MQQRYKNTFHRILIQNKMSDKNSSADFPGFLAKVKSRLLSTVPEPDPLVIVVFGPAGTIRDSLM